MAKFRRTGAAAVFPTGVGVNRKLYRSTIHGFSLPHGRGGEPITEIFGELLD